jgi:hypothetical protein
MHLIEEYGVPWKSKVLSSLAKDITSSTGHKQDDDNLKSVPSNSHNAPCHLQSLH